MSYAHAMSYDHSMSYDHAMSYDHSMSYSIDAYTMSYAYNIINEHVMTAESQNLVSAVALPIGKFLRVRKVFARIYKINYKT